MKKILIHFLAIVVTSGILFSCTSKSGKKLEEKQKMDSNVIVQVKVPASDSVRTISFAPTEIGLTKLEIEKEDGECADGAGKNIEARFEIHVKDSSGLNLVMPMRGWDCGDEQTEGKKMKELYTSLLNAKKADLVMTCALIKNTVQPVSLKIKEKWNEGKNGEPATVEPEVLIWQKGSY